MGAKRVLLVLKGDEVGGAQRSMANLATLFEERGVTCDLVTLRAASDQRLLADWPCTELTFSSSGRRLERWRQWWWLRARMRRGDLDAVIAFGPIANGLVALARPRGALRIVLSERGDPFIERRRFWNRWWMWLYRRAHVMVVPTRLLAAEIRLDWRRPPEIRVIPNTLAPQVPIVPRGVARDVVIVAVGRLAPVKRFQDLIEAFARLGVRSEGWKVVLVGEGEERDGLEALVAQRDLTSRVRFVGLHPAPWEILARAEIFVLCSQHEGFANVLLEAMASGCAVVASNCRFGPRELIEDGVNGLLYPVGDADRLAAALGELIDQPERRTQLARAGGRTVEDFTIDAVSHRWLAVLDEESGSCEGTDRY